MSCAGYHQLKWYYTHPSNAPKYVEVRRPTKAKMFLQESYTSLSITQPIQPPSSWYDLNMGWFDPPTSVQLRD